MFVQATNSAAKSRAIEYDAVTAMGRLMRHRGPEPFVIGQLGQSLDGRIATPTGASKYINGKEALRHLHRIRANVDAVIVGVGTAIADDPQLTTRHVDGPSPARIIIDPRGRVPRDLALFRDRAAPVYVVSCPDARPVPEAQMISVECSGDGNMDPHRIIEALSSRGMTRLLLEGGAETLARFINAKAVDEFHLMLAPIILGSGKTGLNLAPIETLDEARRPLVRTMRFRDGDMLCMCDLECETICTG